ncbi:BSD domain-containing protein [Fulvia fulva]|uniref:BSD domain-containing protein n=1 Tax=Passalora fulva TaxID=5499 RepID=A0A9Q8L4W0_PASFU|nr:BSD domain-containing protein [Fulvia fulva]KAK4635002.1 BSD domain-containing protein [Fulvia fulva]KAK4637664.1 BSD domain-containing protein [Fulvia fulva]UJO10804.1 BSD domain-containing protein [Fulvia fulva]WPV10071.1 BSD domain-containing protein [Fulvia fulva]WPV23454.1 BSD domain-containing protein [Fulvia fulva]
MDVAYDHIQEEALTPDQKRDADSGNSQTQSNLNAEFSEAFKAVSASPWGARLGGWFSQARKQGETFVQDLQKEATEASEQATKGLSSLREQVVQRTRGMTLNAEAGPEAQIPGEEAVPKITTTGAEREAKDDDGATKPESLPADIVKEAGSLVASLRATAVSRLKDLQKAEDAADEALLKFGSNVRNFLRDAVTISAPDDDEIKAGSEVLFETQEPGTGKKIFHTTRLDAQLHAIHTTASSFTEDPEGEEWKTWEQDFDAEKKTEAIATDLEQYEELRRAMEKLVPEKVEYKTFWSRYYFLRKAVEEDEKKRKEVLKGATADTEEEVAWDDDDEEESSTPQPPHATNSKASESTTTLNAPAPATTAHLKPNEPRRSDDENKSVADSDASYDVVSGATSRAQGSPKEAAKKDDESDDDWE